MYKFRSHLHTINQFNINYRCPLFPYIIVFIIVTLLNLCQIQRIVFEEKSTSLFLLLLMA